MIRTHRRFNISPIVAGLGLIAFFSTVSSPVHAQTDSSYLLRYKLSVGEVLRSKVTHLANTDTRMQKVDQRSESRSVSEKVWNVTAVSPDGNMTFVYTIDKVEMSQQTGDSPEISYNSLTDTDPPAVFRKVASSVGKPLATITINSRGQVVKRDSDPNSPDLGMGEIAIPLPQDAIALNAQWSVPREIRAKLEDGTYKTIKIRELYTLQKVSAGVATIRIQSQPLTPVTEPTVESQIVQQMSNGTIKFDIEAGRLIFKQLDWNEKVVGFNGGDSMLNYNARYTEEVLPQGTKTAQAPTPASRPAK